MDPSSSSEFNSTPPSSNSAGSPLHRQFHLAHTKKFIKIYTYFLAISKLFHSINPISFFFDTLSSVYVEIEFLVKKKKKQNKKRDSRSFSLSPIWYAREWNIRKSIWASVYFRRYISPFVPHLFLQQQTTTTTVSLYYPLWVDDIGYFIRNNIDVGIHIRNAVAL